MSSALRVGLVGLDHWYTAVPLAEEMAKREDMTLSGIFDADGKRAEEVARRCGVERVETDWRALVEDGGIDAVASFVSVEQNPEVCLAAAAAGKHLMTIKPMARTLEQAREVVAAVRRAGVSFLPAESLHRVGAQSRALKQWLEEGRLGRLLHASFSLWAGLPQRWPGDPGPGWFADPARTVGGAWVDHAIYHIDLMRFLLGEEVATVAGQVGNLSHPGLPVEDWGVATLSFAGGSRAVLEDTWTAPQGAFQQSATLVGSEGAVHLDGIRRRMLVKGNFPPFTGWVETDPPMGQREALSHWLSAVRAEGAPVATVEDAWDNLAVCVAFYDAASTGSTRTPEKA